ncbi:uncharacterized protein KGF55_003171 [Candida pseudojiufengensis]|uniref:uncharacterized protein n=1 Tax=Candida pseudojiufengensis TaxID=497109 RepID=UPI0022241AD3|nr:uncharacterized protein KGF55_003171 [Candida pseudojiufengensis]KAI5962095.1 hypothetical protein KGF55_003171 [Candida pseudojiufengensis]
MIYKTITISTWLFISIQVHSAILPFKDSIEIAFTPEDVKKTTDYVLWKVPAVKNNFKTTVKQHLLNRLLSKDLQEMPVNFPPNASPQPTVNEPNNGEVQMNDNQLIHPLQALAPTDAMIELELQKPRGVLGSILKGPIPDDKPKAKIRYVKPEPEKAEETGTNSNDMENDQVIGIAKLPVDEHIGYSKPKLVKNRKHNFEKGIIPTPTVTLDDFDNDATEAVPEKDPFYDE